MDVFEYRDEALVENRDFNASHNAPAVREA